jgi:glyoxylase-like metal-dependent hydrolase (beta-lactamase superfamily II)
MQSRGRCGLFCVAILSTVVISAGADDRADTPLYDLVEVTPSVVMALNDNGSNLSCVALEQGLVFFDTGLSTRTAAAFRREMEQAFDRPTMALVLTHAHLDHLFGMAAFSDVPVYSAEAGRPRWEHFVAIEWDERAIAGYGAVFPTLPDEIPDAKLRLPTDWFGEELVLGSGEDQLVIRRTGGHTVDSSSVVVGAGGVVIAGDLVQARRRPYFGEPDTDFSAWIGTLRGWEDLGVMAICPGHGPVIDAAELREMRLWFEGASAAAIKLKAEGATMEELAACDELVSGYWPDDGTAPRWWGYCVKRLYDAS